MALFQSSNPAMSEKVFERAQAGNGTMTINGSINKTAILLFLLLMPALYTWDLVNVNGVAAGQPWMLVGGIGGFIVAMVTAFQPHLAPYTSPFYAVLKGLLLGAVTGYADLYFPGIGIQAILLTLSILFCMLMLFRTGIIKVTEKFRAGVMAALMGVVILYVVSFVVSLFGGSIPFLHDNGPIGLLINGAIVVLAALMLLLDFDFIEKGAASGAPKYMEWYAAFGLMVTLVWLYIEVLSLLMRLQSRE